MRQYIKLARGGKPERLKYRHAVGVLKRHLRSLGFEAPDIDIQWAWLEWCYVNNELPQSQDWDAIPLETARGILSWLQVAPKAHLEEFVENRKITIDS